jgi:hypothetical protein
MYHTAVIECGDWDCDDNGVPDMCELGGSGDSDADGTPDICERRYGDLDLDGTVGGTDLTHVLTVWGSQDPEYGDLSGDGTVDGKDVAFILVRWGPVP